MALMMNSECEAIGLAASKNNPEVALAVAVLQRAITDACSPIGISDSDRRSAMDFIFLELGREWGYSLECIAGYLSDDPESLAAAVRNYVTRVREHYELSGAYRCKPRSGKRPLAPLAVHELTVKDFRERPEFLPEKRRRVER